MRIKRVIAVKKRKKNLFKYLFLLLIIIGAVFFVKERRDLILTEAKHSFEKMISRESDLEIHMGRIRGSLWGRVKFENVRVLTRGSMSVRSRILFSAKEVSFHYQFLDFISKKYDSRISILVQSPRIYWRPRIRLSRAHDFSFLNWMRDWALAQRDNISIQVRNLYFLAEPSKIKFEGINLKYENASVSAEIPLRHLALGSMDFSTVLKAQGRFQLGFFGQEDVIEGDIVTEGSVANWTPLPQESRFHFVFSQSGLRVDSSKILGGIDVEFELDFKNDYDFYWSLTAIDYPVSNLNFLINTAPANALPSRFDLDFKFKGALTAPAVEGRARIYEGFIGKKTFKALDLQVSGVYPTVRLQNSRIRLQDDTVMRFADKALEFQELFSEKTYEELVSEAQQETVVWGDWEFRRPKDINDNSEFLIKHALGDRTRLHFREYKQSTTIQDPDANKMEIGIEYKLQGKNSLKLDLRDDEEFVGVERKVKF